MILHISLTKCVFVGLFVLVFAVVQAGAQDDIEIVNVNPSFENGFEGWGNYINAAASAIFDVDKDAFEGKQCAYMDIDKVSGTNWHVGLTQDGLTLDANETYTVDFFAKADAKRVISLELKRSPALGDWEGITSEDINITEEWTEYSHTFTCVKDYDQGALFALWFGQVKGDVWIDGVRVYWGDKQDREEVVEKSVKANGKLITQWAVIKAIN